MKQIATIVLACLATIVTVSTTLGQTQETLALFRHEYIWRTIYETGRGAKAMAIAENGAYGYATGKASDADAEATALSYCNEGSKFLSLRADNTPACRIVAAGATWKAPDLRLDSEWQKPAKGKDRPMQKGRKVLVSSGKSKGIILLVHGCDGLGAKIFTDVWGAYFNALGYDLYAPDSFAEKRQKPACGSVNDFPATQVSDIWRLRVAQTHRTINGLRKANPEKPIYMWGHSEGGLIVQMIKTDIAGVIVSGEECGVVGAPVSLAPHVPLLYLWGEYDQYVNGVGYRITKDSTAKCASDNATHKPVFAILEGRSHIPWPWNRTAEKAIASFLGGQSLAVSGAAATKKQKSLWKQIRPDKRYRKSQPHRAAAINKSGTSYMVWGLDNEEDARELALFGCAKNTTKKTNIFRAGTHLCAVVDVNGNAPD
jgi:pimeloyl-ACP methyl ester carboxylesterase